MSDEQTIYQKVYQRAPRFLILRKLASDPKGLISGVAVADYLSQPEMKLYLRSWIQVLSNLEQLYLYYAIGKAKILKRYKVRRWGPGIPIMKGTTALGAGAGAIVGGTVGGFGVGGFIAYDSERGIVLNMLETAGGSVVGGVGGLLAGSAVALGTIALATKEYSYGVCKSLVLWPIAPLDNYRAHQLDRICLMLANLLDLVDHEGNWNESYLKCVKGDPFQMGAGLYDLYSMCHQEDPLISVELFLSSFKYLAQNGYFLHETKIYRKMKHFRDLVLAHLGSITTPIGKISSNLQESQIDDWINHWHFVYEINKDESLQGLVRLGIYNFL